jgi:predicted nucleic acid-binding protein
MRVLLDSNVFREIGKSEPNANVAAWLDTVDDADLAISALTVREIRKGIIKLRAKKLEAAFQIEIRVREVFDAFGDRILPRGRPGHARAVRRQGRGQVGLYLWPQGNLVTGCCQIGTSP